MPSASLTPSQDSDDPTSISSCRKRIRALRAGLEYVRPKDENFQTAILDPLGVVVSSSQSEEIKPVDIFGLQSSTPDSHVILRISDKELEGIMGDFAACELRGYGELTLSTVCYDSIVLRDPFICKDLDSEEPTVTTTVRREEWKPKKKGPDIPRGGYTYDWDIQPATTYGVSLVMFNLRDYMHLGCKTCQPWLAENKSMVCPYLTIDYKSGEKKAKAREARDHIIASSILWLHQRQEIRQTLGLGLDDLKHFSITIIDSLFTISEARFQDGLYYIGDLVRGSLTTMDGLKLYIEWNNAIHTWGLGANASSFKEDLVARLELWRGSPDCPLPFRNQPL